MNFRKTDYSANKYAKGIVYRFTDSTDEIDLDSFLSSEGNLTQADFDELKRLSDGIYYEDQKTEKRNTRKNTGLDGFEEFSCALSVPSAEDVYLEQCDQIEKEQNHRDRVSFMYEILASMNTIQRRRYVLHVARQMTIREIAEIEGGVSHQAIHRSIMRAKQKIASFIAGHQNRGAKTGSLR